MNESDTINTLNTKNLNNSEKNISNDSESPEYLDKLKEYYSLKQMYDSNRREKINKILKNKDLNLRQKRAKYSKIKNNCISCDRPVGTIFKNNDGILTAYCGNKEAPCGLSIIINRGKFVKINKLIDTNEDKINSLKKEIICCKLNLLFGYQTEEYTINEFETLKEELTPILEEIVNYKYKYISIIENLKNKDEIKRQMDVYYDKIKEIKDTVIEFNKSENNKLIKDMINNYKNVFIPLVKEVNELKYKYFEMIKDDKIHTLIKKVYTISQILDSYVKPEINEFEINSEISNFIVDNEIDDVEWQEDDIQDIKDIPQINYIRMKGNTQDSNQDIIMFGDRIIIKQSDYKKNKSIISNDEYSIQQTFTDFWGDSGDLEPNQIPDSVKKTSKISLIESNNKNKYQHQYIYIDEFKLVLVAIDKNTGDIYEVDFSENEN